MTATSSTTSPSWILELDRGKGIPYEGNYSSWLVQKQKRLEQEGREDAAHQKTLAREQEWIASSPKARQAKSKARYQRYEDLLKQASEKQTQTAQITIPVAERLGQNVVDFEGLSKGFGDRMLIEDLTFKLPPGGIVGVIGPNGAGKTTLFRMITKQETPDKGTITVGESVHLGYVDQSRDDLDGKKNVWEEISGGNELILLGKREVNSRGYCSSFNFKGADQQKKVGALSGGERNRVHLAKMLKSGANVLLLDEPTNDLDVDTLRALEEALEDFAGCAVIISHDRWFLDRIATHILAFEGDSHVEWFEGNFQDYEKDKMRRLGQDQHHSASREVQEADAVSRRIGSGQFAWMAGAPALRRRCGQLSLHTAVTDCVDIGLLPQSESLQRALLMSFTPETPLPPESQRKALRPIPMLIFSSRWLQLPLYIGLIVAQGVYVVLFLKELWHLFAHAFDFSEQQIMLAVLGLIDVVMISNLLVMVIVGGYETFVSRLNLEGHPDQPEWLSHVNASVLKIKLAMAIIGISSIHLLRTFIEAGGLASGKSGYTETGVMWQTIIHTVFILSAIGIAYVDKLSNDSAEHAKAGRLALMGDVSIDRIPVCDRG